MAAKVFPVFQDKKLYRRTHKFALLYPDPPKESLYEYFKNKKKRGFDRVVLFQRCLVALKRPQTFQAVWQAIGFAYEEVTDDHFPKVLIMHVAPKLYQVWDAQFHGIYFPDVTVIPEYENSLLEAPINLMYALVSNCRTREELDTIKASLLHAYNCRFRRRHNHLQMVPPERMGLNVELWS